MSDLLRADLFSLGETLDIPEDSRFFESLIPDFIDFSSVGNKPLAELGNAYARRVGFPTGDETWSFLRKDAFFHETLNKSGGSSSKGANYFVDSINRLFPEKGSYMFNQIDYLFFMDSTEDLTVAGKYNLRMYLGKHSVPDARLPLKKRKLRGI